MVKYACHAVETKSVETVNIEPHAEIGKEEAKHFPRGVVEETGVPQGVGTLAAEVEVAAVVDVPDVQAVVRVLGGVTVHHIQQNCHPGTMSDVDKTI